MQNPEDAGTRGSSQVFEVRGWHGQRGVQVEVRARSDIEIARRIIAGEALILDKQCEALGKRLGGTGKRDAALEQSKSHPTFELEISPVRDPVAANRLAEFPDTGGPALSVGQAQTSLGEWLSERFPERGTIVAADSGYAHLARLRFDVTRAAPGEGARTRSSFGHPDRYRAQRGSLAQWLVDVPPARRGGVVVFALSRLGDTLDCELLRHRLHAHQVVCAYEASPAARALMSDWDGRVMTCGEHVLFLDPGPRYLDPTLLSAAQAAGIPWPKITVVTVSFNQKQYLDDCLRSVLDQDYPNLEFIVVDGLSTDGSQELLRTYEPRLSKLIIEKDRGQSDGLNKGFDLATGDILTWINSDDMLAPGALRRAAATFMHHRCDLVVGGCERITENSDEVLFLHHAALPFVRKIPAGFYENLIWTHSWARGDYFFQPEVLFTADIWKRSGGFLKEHLYWAMDWELWIRMGMAGAKVVHVPETIGRSRVHGDQKTTAEERYLFQIRNILLEHDGVLEQLAANESLPAGAGAHPPWLANLRRRRLAELRGLMRRLWSLRNPAKLKHALAARLPQLGTPKRR